MITENPPKLLQHVTRILRKSPQQRGLSSNYRAIAQKLSISLIGGAMVAFGTSAAAQAATFVSTNDGKIGKIDATGAFTQVASGSTAFTDIAISDSGKLFGINLSELFQVDLNTGTYSSIGFFGGAIDGDMNALTFGANNTLYGAKVKRQQAIGNRQQECFRWGFLPHLKRPTYRSRGLLLPETGTGNCCLLPVPCSLLR